MLVRLPRGGVSALLSALPRDRTLDPGKLPLVLRVVDDEETAVQTARRLRLVGAAVALLEESAPPELSPYCVDHPTGLAAGTCRDCRRPICPACALAAQGQPLCVDCHQRQQRSRGRTRLRQLFMVFLFCVFLFEVARALREDARNTSPDGVVSVGLFQFVPPGRLHAPVVRALNARPEAGSSSLWSVGAWFDAERERYMGRSGPYLRVSVRGPWVETVRPPSLGGPDDPWWRLALQAWRYVRYFHDLAEDRGVDPDDVAVRVYVIYGDDDGDLAAHSRGSERGRVAVAFVSLDEQNPAYALTTVAHELAHTLGAEDLYDESTGLSKFPEGFVEPFAEPLLPQRYAELMAVDRPIGANTEAEVRSLAELRVGYATAARLGWIGEEQAAWFYDPPSLRAQEALLPETPADTAEEHPVEPPESPDPG